MTGNEYKNTRLAMGHDQATLGRLLGLHRSAIIRRESSASVSKEAEVAIRSLEADHKRAERLKNPGPGYVDEIDNPMHASSRNFKTGGAK